MRVLVVPDRMGPVPAEVAGGAIAQGWQEAAPGDIDVAVVPCGDSGAGFIDALGALWGALPTVVPLADDTFATCVRAGDRAAVTVVGRDDPGFHPERSSAALGRAVAEVIAQQRPRQLVVDLSGTASHDGGAGFLAALGAQADVSLTAGVTGLSGISRIELAAVSEALADVEVIGVYPVAEEQHMLLGLRGITSRRGADLGLDPALMLRTDASLEALARLAGPESAQLPGAGACGGIAWAVAAVGGRILPAVDLLAEWADIEATARLADLLVTGTTAYDFHHKGGGVVARVAGWAGEALRPCVVLAGEVMISSREMRLMGIEAAHPVELSDPDALSRSVERVARTWTWR